MGLLPEDRHACSTSKRQALGNGNHAKKTKLFVNSRHRELSDTNRVTVNDYEWVPEMPLRHVKNIQVEYAEIPTSFTNVVEARGENVMRITITMQFPKIQTSSLANSHTHTFEIKVPEGYYTQQALVAALNTAAAAIPLPTTEHVVHGRCSWTSRTCTIAGSPSPDLCGFLGGMQEVNTDTGGGAYAAGSRYRSTGLIHFGMYETNHQIYIQKNSFRQPDTFPIAGTDDAHHTAVPWFTITIDPANVANIFGWSRDAFTTESTLFSVNNHSSSWEFYAPATSGTVSAQTPPVEGVTFATSFGGVPRIAAYTVIYLTCKELGKSEFERVVWGKNCPRSVYPVLARFQMKAGINYMNFFINEFGLQNYQFTYHDITTIEKFTFMWVDDNGKEVNFHGYDHSFTLSATHGT